MRLNLPRQVIVEEDDSRKKRSEPESKRVKTVVDEVYFDISFPSASEIADFKRTRNQMYTLELQEQDDSAILKVKGQLKHRIVGEARINPRDLRSWDLINIDGLT